MHPTKKFFLTFQTFFSFCCLIFFQSERVDVCVLSTTQVLEPSTFHFRMYSKRSHWLQSIFNGPHSIWLQSSSNELNQQSLWSQNIWHSTVKMSHSWGSRLESWDWNFRCQDKLVGCDEQLKDLENYSDFYSIGCDATHANLTISFEFLVVVFLWFLLQLLFFVCILLFDLHHVFQMTWGFWLLMHLQLGCQQWSQ